MELVFRKFLREKVLVEFTDNDGSIINFQEEINDLFNLLRKNSRQLYDDLKGEYLLSLEKKPLTTSESENKSIKDFLDIVYKKEERDQEYLLERQRKDTEELMEFDNKYQRFHKEGYKSLRQSPRDYESAIENFENLIKIMQEWSKLTYFEEIAFYKHIIGLLIKKDIENIEKLIDL